MHVNDSIDAYLYRSARLWLDQHPGEAARMRENLDSLYDKHDWLWRAERIFVRALKYDHDEPAVPGQGSLL